VLRGQPGVGKTALLGYLSSHLDGWRVARAVGVESEMELAYSALHQLCAPMLDHLDRLPAPQRVALSTVFGLSAGPVPDRFLVALATLTLLAEVAEEQPLACILDDVQWLDSASAQVLGFVGRRLFAERIALVCAARTGLGDDVLAELPAFPVGGLSVGDARALLLEHVRGPLDAAVCDQIVAESHGNPLALLELPRTRSEADLAGGFGFPDSQPVAGRIEESYAHRLLALPAQTRLIVLTAAAEPLGDTVLLHRSAAILGLDLTAANPALDAGLLEIGGRVEFAHPLVRSAAYRAAASADRHRVHRALAEATDPATDPDRRAWHRARATTGPDGEVAGELEQSAGRAQARGGLAAAAAFLQRATALTADPARRIDRALSAAQVTYDAGSLDEALGLLATAQAGPLDDGQRCRLLLLRARIAFASRHDGDGRPLLLGAARDAESIDVDLARVAYLEALHSALHAGRLDPDGMVEVGEAALACPPPSGPARPRDLLLDGLATRIIRGYVAGAPLLKEALAAFRREEALPAEDARWLFLTHRVASDLWDNETHELLSARQLDRARETGALAAIPTVLEARIVSQAVSGDLDEAASTIDAMRVSTEATGVSTHGDGPSLVAALRGREDEAAEVIRHAAHESTEHGDGLGLPSVEYASAVLYNGLGRYEAAVAAVRQAGERRYEVGAPTRATAELVEAAARSGDRQLAAVALERLSETTRASGTEWALGVEARCRALLSEGTAAEHLYREAIDRLSRTRLRPELARAHLLYGEWLRREGRRVDARDQLRTAHEMLTAIGMEAFAERARRELVATGEKVRKRSAETRDELTPQEEQVARLARDGLSNAEIGARLFLSPRTVEWHLSKVFSKLGITARGHLAAALPEDAHSMASV
jgi:DNA-binding CsgD family transcriptional regulator/tetratricopeptide (TPR) repeat protein